MNVKLVHVTSSLMRGGAEKVLYLVVKELQKRDIAQTVIYFNPGPYVTEIEQLGVATYHITGLLWRYDPVFFFRLYKILKQKRPTYIHSLLWAANVSARVCALLQRIPIICAYHNNVEQDGMVRSLLDRLTWRCASRIIAVSEQVKCSLKLRGQAGQIIVIPNGIDVAEKNKIFFTTRQDLGLANDTFIIGAVGRLVSVKRFDYLLRVYALWHCNKSHLIIIGQGPLQKKLKELAIALNLEQRVSFIADVALSYYDLFDCFVQPSCKEGVSLALLEAMNFSKPCIVMGQGYHPVIVHEHNGIVVLPDNQQMLIYELNRLYQDKEYMHLLGRQAVATVTNRFTVEMMGDAYYNAIVSEISVSKT